MDDIEFDRLLAMLSPDVQAEVLLAYWTMRNIQIRDLVHTPPPRHADPNSPALESIKSLYRCYGMALD